MARGPSILDLPPELLHMIFAYRRKDWGRSKKAYANVCRKLRDVAVEYLEFRNSRVDDLDHFMGFMRRHGGL